MKADVLDFASLDTGAACDNPYELELVHPVSKKPLGVFVEIVGMESAEIKALLRQHVNRDRLKAFQAQRDPSKVAPDTIEEDEADTVKLATKLTKGWRTVLQSEVTVGSKPKSEPVVIWAGEKLEFTPDNVGRWLTAFPWARGQIIEAAGELSNFLGN